MYNTCSTGCCSSNVPIRDSSHAKCHCQDTHLCESPVITKRVSNCDDGCCTSKTVSIQNSDEVRQYVNALRDEHLGHSEFNANRTLNDISKKPVTANCCPTSPPRGCKTPDFSTSSKSCGSNSYTVNERRIDNAYYGIQSNSCNTGCGCGVPDCGCGPALHYEDLNCSTSNQGSCCDSGNVAYIKGLANRVRGSLNHRCHTYGDIRETIKEIPAANVYLVNHEFVDLLIDEILGCLPVYNISREVVKRVKNYVRLYYVYYKDLELIGSLVISDLISVDENLITSEVEAERTKAVLYALKDRLEGRINGYEQ